MKMKNINRVILVIMMLSLVFPTISAHAAELDTRYSGEEIEEVCWSGSAYVSTKHYCNVTSSNNFFPDSPKVTNSANNPGKIYVRILNSSGQQVGRTKTIAVGKSVTMDQIPAFSGTYTLQAKAVTSSGYYSISID